MALRIGVDAWNLPGDHRGIGRYTRALLRSWSGYSRDHIAPTLIIPEWPPLLHAPRYRQELGGVSMPVMHRGAVTPRSFDLIWFPWNGMSWIPPGIGIATLHDASLFALPPDSVDVREREQRPFRVAAATATRIITDSYFSKGELSRHLNIEPDRIDVVHLGVDPVRVAPGPPPVPQPYLLFVGETEHRKGIDILETALAKMTDPPLLVIAGKRSGSEVSRDDRVTSEMQIPSRYLGHVSESVLASLYAGAKAVIYPSRYEGFGLPVLEAMAYGAPVVASDAAGIPEAGGDAALYFPSGDADALANAIELVLSEDELADNLRELGRRRAGSMTWDVTASQTVAIFERVFKIRRRRAGSTPGSNDAHPHLVRN
ncbi:MAG: glycosyltransferase family 4 protein [Candidatus Eremiobacteraeota bacterium]|nr:glycosyltransferase family 4 protein [Candidatus Eremiobacteraeota bacterium]